MPLKIWWIGNYFAFRKAYLSFRASSCQKPRLSSDPWTFGHFTWIILSKITLFERGVAAFSLKTSIFTIYMSNFQTQTFDKLFINKKQMDDTHTFLTQKNNTTWILVLIQHLQLWPFLTGGLFLNLQEAAGCFGGSSQSVLRITPIYKTWMAIWSPTTRSSG